MTCSTLQIRKRGSAGAAWLHQVLNSLLQSLFFLSLLYVKLFGLQYKEQMNGRQGSVVKKKHHREKNLPKKRESLML